MVELLVDDMFSEYFISTKVFQIANQYGAMDGIDCNTGGAAWGHLTG
jgi:hypothetical protein